MSTAITLRIQQSNAFSFLAVCAVFTLQVPHRGDRWMCSVPFSVNRIIISHWTLSGNRTIFLHYSPSTGPYRVSSINTFDMYVFGYV